MDNKLFFKESVLPVTLFCSALMFSPIGVAQMNAATNVVQQAKTVKGTVVDNMGEPVIGASVKVVGTTNGAVTDLDGNFALTNVPKNATVEISYIGYTTQKVSVAGKSDLKVTLLEDNKALDEVVVVGYGVQRKSDVTGALAHLDSKDLTAMPVRMLWRVCRVRLPVWISPTPSALVQWVASPSVVSVLSVPKVIRSM